MHPLPDVDPAIWSDNVAKVAMVDDFVGVDVKTETHVVRVWHGGVEIKIGKANTQKLGPRGTDGGINE